VGYFGSPLPNAGQLLGSVSRTSGFWNTVGLVGFTLGPVLVGARLVLAVLSTLEAPHGQTLAVEAAACFGALVGGWGLARLTGAGAARVWGQGRGCLLGAIAGGSVGAFGGDLLIRHGSRIIMGLAFGGGLRL